MSLFDSSRDTTTNASPSQQGSHAQDKGSAANINLSAGDDQGIHGDIIVKREDHLTQIDRSDNSVRNTDNSFTDESVRNIDESDRSVRNIDRSDRSVRTTTHNIDRSDRSVTNIDNSQRFDTDLGAIKESFAFADAGLDFAGQNTRDVFGVVTDLIEIQTDSFNKSVDQIQQSAASEVERGLDSVLGLTQDAFWLVGGMVAIVGAVMVWGK